VIYGIEGQDFTAGVGVSRAVAQAIGQAARSILSEVQTLQSNNESQAR
jgi:hypothetical protein